MNARTFFPLLALTALCLAGCDNNMRHQARYDPLEASPFFKDGRSARPLVEGTVARGDLREDEHLETGKIAGAHAVEFPFPVDESVLRRGQERYQIYCSVCHDGLGYGRGMVVRRGFKQPPSFHEERLKQAPAGYFFDVITHGFGAMYDYAAQINVHDRWAIIAYIRALQLSQNALIADIPLQEREKLQAEMKNTGFSVAGGSHGA